ncbi:MFS transporter [Povalibacter sp.]|uniref:spinster family MFS transporter n=1 Tax=Povalibacter sp. TaxID=1962978 RepID=UPI002F407E82
MATTTAPIAGSVTDARSYGTPGYRLYVLVMLTLVYTLNFIDRNLVNVIAQPIIQEFQLSDSQYGFLNGPPFAIFYALMGIPIAMAADRYNRVVIVAICISIWSLMTALCGLASSFAFLLIARIGVAIGEAGSTPPSNSILADYYTPKNRAAALAVFAMGVTIGSALANYFGGPIARHLNGPALQRLFDGWGWDWMVGITDWSQIAGWRAAFVVIGAPGLIIGLITLLTVKEPPRGYSDPPGTVRPERAGIRETLRELSGKSTFWTMALGASIISLAGYGLVGFQAPMVQRLHGVEHGAFAIQFGGPLAIVAAFGTFAGGMIVHRLTPRIPTAVALVPAIGALLAVPIYIFTFTRPTDEVFSVMRSAWCVGAFCHYMYLGSQYTIGQGVVSQRSRASAVAILLLMIALIGNGIGPLFVGWLSDLFMNMEMANAGTSAELTSQLCRNAVEVAKLAADQQSICRGAYGEGLKLSMITTTLFFIPAALCFYLSSRTLLRDMVARQV